MGEEMTDKPIRYHDTDRNLDRVKFLGVNAWGLPITLNALSVIVRAMAYTWKSEGDEVAQFLRVIAAYAGCSNLGECLKNGIRGSVSNMST